MNLKKGDIVKIIAGKDKGKSGKILRIFGERERILVEGINISKKHARPKKKGETGEVVSIPKSLAISNAMLICANCKMTARVGHRDDAGRKQRYCKKCSNFI